ncbi:9424_t:CDS:10, partial [Paraglomus occultum]
STPFFTPLQEHYLKRELISCQVEKELLNFAAESGLSFLGPPFSTDTLLITPSPFLYFIFHNHVLTFPFLRPTKNDFWNKIREFIDQFNSKNISSTVTRDEATRRRKLAAKFVGHVTLLLNAGIKSTLGQDENLKVSDWLSPKDQQKEKVQVDNLGNAWELNIVGVRIRVEKGKLKERAHPEYIILTKRPGTEDVYVARRYRDFRTLFNKLKDEFSDIEILDPPKKIKDTSKIGQLTNRSSAFPKYRYEKNRLNLRVYIRHLLRIRKVAQSQLFQDFLLKDPIELTENDQKNISERAELDSIKDERIRAFEIETERQMEGFYDQIEAFKQELLKCGGLSHFAATIRETAEISQLPPTYQEIIKWGEISFASTLYRVFVGSDTSSATFAKLKNVHSLMPYKAMHGILKISNPLLLMRAMMLSTNLNEEIRDLQRKIDTMGSAINDPVICEKLKNYSNSSVKVQEIVKNEADAENANAIVRAILHTSTLQPQLSPESLASTQETQMFDNVKRLFFLYLRKRDKEMMVDLLFQGVTGSLFREILAMFYEPLARVYKAANFGDSLSDISNFVNDLIQVVEDLDDKKGLSTNASTESIVQTFLSLVRRHSQRFYSFVHAIYSHDTAGIFSSLVNWMDTILSFARDGLPERIDMGRIARSTLTTDEQEKLFSEIEQLIEWHKQRKRSRLDKFRKAVYAQYPISDDSAPLSSNVIQEIGVDNLMEESMDFMFDSSSSEDDDNGDIKAGKYSKANMKEFVTVHKLLNPFVEEVRAAISDTVVY